MDRQQLFTLLDELRDAVDAEMRSILGMDETTPEPFLGMMHYHMGWRDASLNPHLSEQGKRLRPILVLLVCAASGGDWRKALPAAASLEILHNFTLVHDDIEDDSPTRRGRDTMFTIWGVPQAINTGDGMFSYAQLAMAKLTENGVPANIVVQAMTRLNEMCIQLTRGQYLDMSFEQRDSVTVDEYMEMIAGKTSVLIEFACEVGAMVADSSPKVIENFRVYGLNLGLAFQVIDDILGIWGDEDEIGKSASSDILTKKKTLPVLYGLSQSEALQAHYESPSSAENFVATTIQHLDEVSAKQYAEGTAEELSTIAKKYLAHSLPRGKYGIALRALTDYLLERTN